MGRGATISAGDQLKSKNKTKDTIADDLDDASHWHRADLGILKGTSPLLNFAITSEPGRDLKLGGLMSLQNVYRSVPLTPTAPAEPRQQRPSAHEQHGGATRLGYYDEPCHEADGIWGSRPRVHIRIENARNPVAKWTDGIKHGRRSSAEVAHIEQQIAQGRVVQKRRGQRDDDIEILRAAWRTCERAGERKRATGEHNSVISAYIVGIGRTESIISGAGR